MSIGSVQTNSFPQPTRQSVVIMPGDAEGLSDAREQMSEAKDLFVSLGVEVGKDIMRSAAVTAQASPEQMEALSEAGFQVIEDKEIPGGAAQSVKDLESGWLINNFGYFGPFDPFAPLRPEPRPMPTRRRQSSEGPTDYTGQLSATGKGVTIAVLDTGVYPHPDLGDRLLANVSAVPGRRRGSQDPVGHGTHVAADAAGSGSLSGGRLAGPAPEANIVGIQVLGEAGSDPYRISQILDEFTNGVEWMVENKDRYNIRVANMSLGFPLQVARQGFFGPKVLFDPIGAAISEAVSSGIVVVAAAGNDGPYGKIENTPGMHEEVITVGALDTNGTPKDKSDDSVAEFSSRGPTPDGRIKPDILAPGVNILSANSPGSDIAQQNEMMKQMKFVLEEASDREIQGMVMEMVYSGVLPRDAAYMHPSEMRELLSMGMEVKDHAGDLEGDSAYLAMDGTSMAAPIVAGVVAGMLEVNPALSPQDVKTILKETAQPLRGESRVAQGAGAIDAEKAIEISRRLAQRWAA